MIQSIPFSVFDLPELLALGAQSHQIVSERYPEEALLTNILQHLSNALKEAEAAVGSTTKEALTDEVKRSDVPTDVAAEKKLKLALEGLYGGINAFFIGGLITGIEDTIDVLNEAIDRALSSARQSS